MPDTVQVTGLNTYQISQHVRCEFKDAVRFYILRLLRRYGQPDIAQQLEDNPAEFRNLRKLAINESVKFFLDKYANSQVGIEYTFDITEQNTIGTSPIGFTRLFTGGSDKIGLSAAGDFKRQSITNVRVIDLFEDIALNYDGRFCTQEPARSQQRNAQMIEPGVNYVYPIVGTVGLEPIVGDFLDFNQSGGIAPSEKSPDGPRRYARTLNFTTTLSSGLGVDFSALPAGRLFVLVSGGAKFDAKRTDQHQATIVITRSDKVGPPNQKVRALEYTAADVELDRQRAVINSQNLGSLSNFFSPR